MIQTITRWRVTFKFDGYINKFIISDNHLGNILRLLANISFEEPAWALEIERVKEDNTNVSIY